MKLPQLAIFDCDGVITETAYLHYLAWKKITFEKFKIELNETYLNIFRGLSRKDSLQKILEAHPDLKLNEQEAQEFINLKNEYYQKLIKDKKNIKVYQTMIEFIKQLKLKKVLIAVASTSRNSKILLEIFGIDQLFDYIVDPSEIENHKPAPDIFLNAASHFNIDPKNCWAIEDAKVGVSAIKSAGMFAIGIGEVNEVGQADIVFETCDEIDLTKILNKLKKEG